MTGRRIWNFRASPNGRALDVEIYGVIGDDLAGESTLKTIAKQLSDYAGAAEINVHINSDGGSAFDGLAIYNLLVAHRAAKTCVVEGVAASAASIVAMAGRVVMGRGSMMMVHNPWTIAVGDGDDLRHTAEMLDKVRDSLAIVYTKKTGRTLAEIKMLLKRETWMTAEEAKAAGFADEIEEVPIAVEARAGDLLVNGIAFARARVPQQLLARAKAEEAERQKMIARLVEGGNRHHRAG